MLCSPDATARMSSNIFWPASCTLTDPSAWLTAREQEVLDHLALGRSVREIAAVLQRSPHTVHDHVKSLHRKLGANTRGGLIPRAIGLI